MLVEWVPDAEALKVSAETMPLGEAAKVELRQVEKIVYLCLLRQYTEFQRKQPDN